ncbi:MAG: 2-C-methyl-D-erythritol 4-phosphate cytidylyltransferase [Paludibacteraceae bacterium]
MNYQKTVILVAGGKGERMNTTVPKQFLELDNLPILMHTMSRFYDYSPDMELILVLPEGQLGFWENLCKRYNFTIPHRTVLGGETRFFSVKNALETIDNPSGLIAIHDGVRPLVDIETIGRCFEEAGKSGAAIPVMELVDSIRKMEKNTSKSVDRKQYRLVQTPQVFQSKVIFDSYNQPYKDHYTDDASVVESFGHPVSLVEGNRKNIKITDAVDLHMAKLLLNQA